MVIMSSGQNKDKCINNLFVYIVGHTLESITLFDGENGWQSQISK